MAWLLAASLVAVIGAGCGGDDDSGEPAAEEPAAEEPAAEEPAAEEPAAEEPAAEPEPPDLTGASLVLASWGGTWSETTREVFAEPFAQETGAEVTVLDVGGGWAPKLEAQRQAGAIEWDMIDGVDSTNGEVLIEEGFLEPLPADLKSELEAVSVPGAVTDYGIVIGATSMVIACQPYVERCPANPQEYWDFENFPGRRSFMDHNYTLLPMAMESLGVAPEDIYPIDLDAAFAQAELLRDEAVLITESSDQVQQVLRNEEVDMAIGPSGRFYALIAEGMDLTINWGGAMVSPGYIVVLADSENKEAAFEYMRTYARSAERQAAFADALSYGMASSTIAEYLSPETAEQMPGAHETTWVDPRWFYEHSEEIAERWQDFLIGG